ncbi:MAG: GxxExxY protein [Candidatus Omnitrophica bacterium]|nr:GxxExxY protein [Candidatus Omnitrophota bacterium]
MKDKEFIFKDESYKILGACFEVYNEIGSGFLEAVYQECLAIEFKKQGIPFTSKPVLDITYKNFKLEQIYQPDFICYKEIILELKAVSKFREEHKAQIFNYLKASGKRLGFLINFGNHPKIEYQRVIV